MFSKNSIFEAFKQPFAHCSLSFSFFLFFFFFFGRKFIIIMYFTCWCRRGSVAYMCVCVCVNNQHGWSCLDSCGLHAFNSSILFRWWSTFRFLNSSFFHFAPNYFLFLLCDCWWFLFGLLCLLLDAMAVHIFTFFRSFYLC